MYPIHFNFKFTPEVMYGFYMIEDFLGRGFEGVYCITKSGYCEIQDKSVTSL